MFKSTMRFIARVRTPCVVRAKRIIASSRPYGQAVPETTADPGTVTQLLLFAEAGGKVKRQRSKRLRKRAVRGLQYRLKIPTRLTPRKIACRLHAAKEEDGNEFLWTMPVARQLHTILLREALESLKGLCEKRSARAAEIMYWIERDACEEPFSFESCCRHFNLDVDGESIGPQDPEVLRNMTRAWIKKAYGAELPHASVLRQGVIDAEAGDEEAIQWVLSDVEAPLSFTVCCDALGFDPEEAREQILLPIPAFNFIGDPLSDAIDNIIDRVFNAKNHQAALAA